MRAKQFQVTARYRFLLKLVGLFLIYFLSAKIGLSLDPLSGYASLVWPPTGIALAALLLYGYRLWPAITLGAFAVNLVQGGSLPISAGIAFGNTLEALAGYYLLRNFAGFRNSFDNLLDVAVFVFYAVIVSTVISATIGSTTLLLGGVASAETYGQTWAVWWIGDILGSLIVAPFILLWFRRISFEFNLKRIAEAIILLAFLGIVTLVVFAGLFDINTPPLPINYLIYLPLIVIALRFGPKEYSLAMLLLSTTAVWGAANGYSIFASGNLISSLFLLGTFLGATAVTFLSLSVLMKEKRILEARKDEFLAIASHELKTPATTIKAYIDLLKKGGKQKIDKELYIQRIDEQIQRLIKLVNDMLDINRISTGKIELGTDSFPIADFVKKNVRDLQKMTRRHKLLFRGRTNINVDADRYKISQVLTNLILNAIKFSPEKSKIIVSVTSTSNTAKISIRDFGAGISRQYQADVFKRFFQISKEHKSGRVGLGLGLYISREIIKKHGGRMWVRSTPGRGSTFFFTLPKAKTTKT